MLKKMHEREPQAMMAMWNYSKCFVCLLLSSMVISPVHGDAQLKLAVYQGLEFVHPNLASNVQQAFLKHNIPITLSDPLPPQRSLSLAASGRYVGDILRQPRAVKNIQELVQVPIPLTEFKYWVWVLEEQQCPKTWEDLRHAKPVGLLGLHYFHQAYEFSKVGHEEVTSIKVLASMLKLNRADYTLGTNVASRQLSALAGVQFRRCFERPMNTTYGYLYLHQAHQSWFEKIKNALTPLAIH